MATIRQVHLGRPDQRGTDSKNLSTGGYIAAVPVRRRFAGNSAAGASFLQSSASGHHALGSDGSLLENRYWPRRSVDSRLGLGDQSRRSNREERPLVSRGDTWSAFAY